MNRQAVGGMVLLAALLGSGCGLAKDFRKDRHLKAAQSYSAEKKWKEATIEYRNALRYDPENLQAVKQLGLAYYENGQLGEAFPPLRRYRDQNPEDLEVRQKLGTIYLMGQAPDKARDEANAILLKEPQNLEALLLYAESANTPEEIKEAIERLEKNRASLGDPDRVARAMGVLYARNQDVPRAEAEFKQAVNSKPDSPEAHLALARLHLGKRELEPAEKEFKAAAELAPAGSFARLQLADFYLLTRRVDDAVKVLEQTTTEAPDAFPAWLRRAEIAFAQGKLDEAQSAVDAVLKTQADNASALIIQTRIHLAKRDSAKALESAQKAVKSQPANGVAHYVLAMAQAANGKAPLALAAAKDAVARAPMLAEAVFLLAELQLQSGDTVGAVTGLKAYLEGQPKDARAWEALGKAQLRSGDRVGAHASFTRTVELQPQSPRGPYLVGLALRAQGKTAEARQQFEKALAMAPGFTEPLEQLATLSFVDKDPQAAISRIERQAMLQPKSPSVQYLLGRAYQAAGDTKQAEKAYMKAIELNPDSIPAYVSLGQIYGASKEYDRAIAELDKALAARPDQPAALMLKAIAQQMKGDAAGAREGYEKLLKTSPRFAPAANNLAWMLSEDGPQQDLSRALLLAQTARDAAPQDPQIADTLGWVLYKQGAFPRAEQLLREAAEKIPNNPEVLYHLGMAQARLDRNTEARASLTKAIELSPNFPGADQAKATLAALPPSP